MSKVLTKNDLLKLSNEEVLALTKNKVVTFFMSDGRMTEDRVKNLMSAANEPHYFTDFMTTTGITINLQLIDRIEIVD